MESKTSATGAARTRSNAASRRDKRLRDLQRNLHILSAVVRRTLEQGPVEALPGTPITPEQSRLLRFIVSRRGAQVGEVATGLGITAASASLALDRLEILGHIERRKNDRDRRSVQVVATRSGRGLVDRVGRIADAKLSRAADLMGVRDTKQVSELAAEMTRVLMEDEKYFGDVCMQCGAGCSKSCVIHELFESCPFQE